MVYDYLPFVIGGSLSREIHVFSRSGFRGLFLGDLQ